jgi:hypothetical protein
LLQEIKSPLISDIAKITIACVEGEVVEYNNGFYASTPSTIVLEGDMLAWWRCS